MSEPQLARASVQPLIMVGTGAVSVGAGATITGVLRLFGAAFEAGTTDPPGKFFTHRDPIKETWEIIGFASFIGQARGTFGEGLAALNLLPILTLSQAQAICDWQSRMHGQNLWFEAARIISLPCPYIVLPDTQLYFLFNATNLSLAAATFDVQMHIRWRYHQKSGP